MYKFLEENPLSTTGAVGSSEEILCTLVRSDMEKSGRRSKDLLPG
jgi:hypothetical protein